MVESNAERLDRVFRALSDATRRDMLRRLCAGEHTVSELAEPFHMSLAAASKHIRTLEDAGLIRRTVEGRVHRCRLEPSPLMRVGRWLRHYEKFWSSRLDDLERALKEPT
jgi:DNA-binding transcriptional ArsR family regulator